LARPDQTGTRAAPTTAGWVFDGRASSIAPSSLEAEVATGHGPRAAVPVFRGAGTAGDAAKSSRGRFGWFADIGTGFVRGRADGSSSPTAGLSEMRVARFENGRDLLSTRRGPRGSGAGARASHPSRAAVLPPPYEPSG
jgi:hypothetical protein